MKKLNKKIAVYVPSTFGSLPIDNTPYANHILNALSCLFGGATSQPGTGAWISDTGALIVENVTICFSYCSRQALKKNRKALFAIAKDLCKELKQDCVSVEINGKLFFV